MKLIGAEPPGCRRALARIPEGGWMLSIVPSLEGSTLATRWLYHHGVCGWWMMSDPYELEECLLAERDRSDMGLPAYKHSDDVLFLEGERLYSLEVGAIDALLMAFRLMGDDKAQEWFSGKGPAILEEPDHEL